MVDQEITIDTDEANVPKQESKVKPEKPVQKNFDSNPDPETQKYNYNLSSILIVKTLFSGKLLPLLFCISGHTT